jgi:hypothetical protein
MIDGSNMTYSIGVRGDGEDMTECGCMGDFDLHIDRKGNLRIIQDGVLLYTLAPKPKEAP